MYLKQENNTYRREEEPMKKDGAVGMQINCVSNLIRRSIDLRIAGMPGEKLSRMDSWIIHYMLDHQQEDVFQKDVEKALAMTRSNVSKAVDQMVSKGLIMRSPVDYDARLKKLTLTPKVLEIHRQIEGEIAEFEKLLVEGFTTRELEQFKDYLERIAHNINDNTKRQQDERKRRVSDYDQDLASQIKEYKKVSIATPIFMILEVIMETIIPMMMASIIDNGVSVGDAGHIYKMGALMLLAACFSLFCGFMGGKYGAKASTGFAKNLRKAMYENIQTFSFSNIDKFSTAGLVTRLTTDVTNIQNAYQMLLRMCMRAPFSLICAMVMSFAVNTRIATVYLIAVLILGAILAVLLTRTTKYFNSIFKKYDDLNESVQENVSAIRVVKAYVREDHEKEKFTKASGNVCRLFTKAEAMICLNMPIMQFAVYTCILVISWMGAHMIVSNTLTTGDLSMLLTYCMNILMNLMMLSMIFDYGYHECGKCETCG